jgi:hypothetical protein
LNSVFKYFDTYFLTDSVLAQASIHSMSFHNITKQQTKTQLFGHIISSEGRVSTLCSPPGPIDKPQCFPFLRFNCSSDAMFKHARQFLQLVNQCTYHRKCYHNHHIQNTLSYLIFHIHILQKNGLESLNLNSIQPCGIHLSF